MQTCITSDSWRSEKVETCLQTRKKFIDVNKHTVLEAAHPSGLSAHRCEMMLARNNVQSAGKRGLNVDLCINVTEWPVIDRLYLQGFLRMQALLQV
jgi:hypothetical protein